MKHVTLSFVTVSSNYVSHVNDDDIGLKLHRRAANRCGLVDFLHSKRTSEHTMFHECSTQKPNHQRSPIHLRILNFFHVFGYTLPDSEDIKFGAVFADRKTYSHLLHVECC